MFQRVACRINPLTLFLFCEFCTAATCHGEAVDLRVLGDGTELDHHLAAAVGRGAERPGDGLVLASRGRVDVEVAQHRRAVDGHVEHTLSGRGQVGLREVERHRLRAPRREVGDRVAERSVTFGIEDRCWRCVAGYLRHVDCRGVGVGAATRVVLVGREAPGR